MPINLRQEEDVADFLLWISFLTALASGAFFTAQIKFGICGWEVAYMAVIEAAVYIVAIGWETTSPFTVYLTNGRVVPWLRYLEWLITCPVILIALSRVGQTGGGYSRSTMKLLTSDQGTIILGIFAACTESDVGQTAFYLCGVAYGFTTFYTAASVYVEAWRSVPDECKSLLKVMAYFFYSGWLMFPVLFVVGPEGAGHLSDAGSTIGHSIADLLSKQSWGVCEYLMENKLHLINERLEMEEEEEEAKLALVGATNVENKGSGKCLVVDTSFTVGTFYEQQLTKMGAEVDLVDTLQAALEMLQNVPEDEKMHDMLLISTFDLNNDALMDAIDATGVPIVAFHADMNTLDDDILSKADDIVPTPVFGTVYNAAALTMAWCKHSHTKAILDTKDVIIENLFKQIQSQTEPKAATQANISPRSSLPPQQMVMNTGMMGMQNQQGEYSSFL